MEFVETPTSWCPHLDPATCTNFSPRTVKLRLSESREIFHFPFLLSPFPFFLSTNCFPFFLFSFLLSFFYFRFAFLFFFSFLILFPFHFLLSLCIFSSFLEHTPHPVEGGNFLPFSSNHLCDYQFSILFPFFFIPLYDIIIMWLIVSHTFKCTTWLFQVSLSWGAMWPPLNLAMCHPTTHTSKNVKSRPPQNSTKFDVLVKFRETSSTEKSVSSSEV